MKAAPLRLVSTDLDPEASQGNNNMSGAFEDYSMPQTASFGFGFNIKF